MYGIPEGGGIFGDLERSLASAWASRSWTTDLPNRLMDAFRGSVPADGAALLFAADASRLFLHAVCTSPGLPERVEDLQEVLGEGPATEAFKTRRPVLVPDLGSTDPRWVAFSGEVTRDRGRAMYAFPLEIGTVRIGVLDLYQLRPRVPTARDVVAAAVAAEVIAGGLLDVLESSSGADGLGPWYDRRGRFMIMQRATSTIAAQLNVSTEEAGQRLRAHAFGTGRPLSDVVADASTGRLRLER